MENKINYSKEFKKYWDSKGKYHVTDNAARTCNSICTWLESCESIEDIDEHVCTLRSRKESTRRIMVDFFEFLKKEKRCAIISSLNDKRFYDSPMERQLEIAKYLHEPHTAGEIEESFDINRETRKKDLQALREGIEVLGSTVRIEEERNGRKIYYKTTIHPIFLPLNLTEIYALTVYIPHLLRGGNPNKEIVEDIVERIKSQLTDYAYNKLFPGEVRRRVPNDYLDDEKLAHQRKGTLMYLMKSGRRCKFFWKGSEYTGKIIYTNNIYRIKTDEGIIIDADPEKPGEVEFVVLDYR